MFTIIIAAITILLLFAVLPIWPYSKNWGYQPAITLAIILLIVASFNLMSSNIETLPRSNLKELNH